jgi:4-diphosphocytidyl-2-C-methyl-D-erythritol kinase
VPALTLPAPAKLNLYLEVLGRRDDGFHELEMVFQALDLADHVTVTWDPEGSGTTCTCDDPALPAGPGNLAWRAAESYRTASGLPGAITVHVAKGIPHGAGLGGGSSDAASTLLALHRLTGGRMAEGDLARLALDLGSDVPFFLVGGTAHARGRGEILTPLPPLDPQPITVLMPDAVLPTPQVFKALTEAERGPRPARGADEFAGRAAHALLSNRLTGPARRLCPAVGGLLDHLAGTGLPHLMTGSGAACFVLGELTTPPPGCRRFVTRPRTGVA